MKKFETPPQVTNQDGEPRRVGLEIELAGLDVEHAAGTLAGHLGGDVERDSAFVHHVRGSELGDLRVELDASALKSADLQDKLHMLDEASPQGKQLREGVERALSAVAGTVVPCEIVTDPIELGQLPKFEAVLDILREQGAEGTKASPLYAFGLHFNPDLPSERNEDLFAHLQAFVLMYPELLDRGEVDWSRRLTPFIDPFEEDYVQHLLTSPAPESLDQLIRDYVDYNPTRNRALDMLCAFRALRPEIVERRIDDPRIQPRKTFHYRLANSRVDEAEWSVAEEWNRWVEVERLAADEGRLRERIEAWRGEHGVSPRSAVSA